MPRNAQQRRAELVAQFEKEVEALLEWEKTANRPNLTQIEDVVLAARQRLGQALANNLIEGQAAKFEATAQLPTDPQTGKNLHSKGKKKPIA